MSSRTVFEIVLMLVIAASAYRQYDIAEERNAWALHAASVEAAYERHLLGEYRKSLCGITAPPGASLSVVEGTCLEGARQAAKKVVEATTKK